MCGVCHAIRPAKASPCGACLSGTLPEMELSGRQGLPGPTLVGVQGLSAGVSEPLVSQHLSFMSRAQGPGSEVLGKQPY